MAQSSGPFNGLRAPAIGVMRRHMGARIRKAMILAAGRGRRMNELTEEVPKPLLEVGGEPLIVRQVRRLAAAGVVELVVNLSYRGEAIREALGDGARWGAAIEYSDEGPEPLETGGGIVEALPRLGSRPFLVVNADVYTDFDFSSLTLARGLAELVLVPNPPHHPAGDFTLGPDGRVGGDGPARTLAGISAFAPALFAGLDRGVRPLKPILDAAIAAGEVHGRLHEGLWLDVGTPERLDLARRVAGSSSGR